MPKRQPPEIKIHSCQDCARLFGVAVGELVPACWHCGGEMKPIPEKLPFDGDNIHNAERPVFLESENRDQYLGKNEEQEEVSK